MNSVRPDNTDPIPLRASPHRMGTILIRFVGLLVVAVVVLALAWREEWLQRCSGYSAAMVSEA